MQSPIVHVVVAVAALLVSPMAYTQGAVSHASPPAAESKPAESKPVDTPQALASIDALSWLPGCWRGTANQREFREHWLPLRGNLLVGAGHTVNAGRTQDFEYMRVEPRADGLYYVAVPSGQKEAAFKLASRETDGPDTIFTFANAANAFPQSIIYRRATGGWLYVHVEGKVGGEDRKVIYPLRRVDCETGDFIDR